jgi:hypothetical protein
VPVNIQKNNAKKIIALAAVTDVCWSNSCKGLDIFTITCKPTYFIPALKISQESFDNIVSSAKIRKKWSLVDIQLMNGGEQLEIKRVLCKCQIK